MLNYALIIQLLSNIDPYKLSTQYFKVVPSRNGRFDNYIYLHICVHLDNLNHAVEVGDEITVIDYRKISKSLAL